MGDTLPLVMMFGAVAAVWVGGTTPAIAVAIAGYIACAYLFIEPRHQIGIYALHNVVGLLAYLFTCSLIIGFGGAVRFAQRRSAERGQLLRVTLSSIGDAVITTDNTAHVTYLNPVAESLTGWSEAEARGQPLDTVFRIINEQSREAMENPALRALREGSVTGLANHAVLIARDGVERPIDDSAAPIKDEDGGTSGCVLIFRDITERRRLEEDEAARLISSRLLSSIVESSDDAIISKSLGGIIQTWN